MEISDLIDGFWKGFLLTGVSGLFGWAIHTALVWWRSLA